MIFPLHLNDQHSLHKTVMWCGSDIKAKSTNWPWIIRKVQMKRQKTVQWCNIYAGTSPTGLYAFVHHLLHTYAYKKFFFFFLTAYFLLGIFSKHQTDRRVSITENYTRKCGVKSDQEKKKLASHTTKNKTCDLKQRTRFKRMPTR